MKEHIKDEKKTEEIKVEEVKKDEYIEQQEENFKKQHQRYTENEKQKEMKKSAEDEDADLEAKLKEMEEEILREKLGEKRESVHGLAPELIPEKKKKELYKGRKPNAFPPSLLASLNEVIAWGDNVQAASSQPVQAAVQRLMEAKTEDEASLELALLINKSIKYLALRGEQWHWPGGNGIRRINTVKRLVKGLFSYAADQSSSYLQSVNNQVENLENFRNKKTANLYKKYMKEGLDLYNEKLGVSEEDTAEELQEARKVEEETQEENAGKFESEMAEAILRLELRNEPEYKRHNALVYKEDKKLNAKKVIRDIESFRIPDICSMSDREVLSYPNLDYMRHDEYLPLKLKFERLVAFGHIKDVDKIQRLRAKMRSFDQSLKLYEARLKVIAGEDDNPAKEEGTAKYKYEHMAGYGLSVDDMTENNLNEIKAAEEERFEAFPAMYREIYGKSPSKDELKKRRLIFEQGVSRKEYFNTGFEVRNKAADIDANLMTKDEEGKTVQLDRSLYGLFFYGFEEVPQYDEYEEKNLTVIHTTDDIKDLIKKITSKDQKERYKGYNTMIYFARGIDFSEFLDTSSDEAIFCDNAYKQTILQILSQVNATVEHMTKDGYPLRKEDRDLLNALGAMGLSINTTIGMTQSALNTANSELFTMAEIKKLSNMSNGLGEMTDNDDLNALITKLGSLKSESRDYDKGVDFDYLLRRSKAQYSGGSLTKEFISSRLALGRLKNKDYEAEIILKGEPFSKSLVKDALRTIKLYTPEKPVGTNRDDALDKIYKYESGRLQVEEMEAYLKKHGKTLTPEQQEIIDTQKKNYKLYAPYYKKMAELINSRGFVDMVNKGVYLDINQCLSPGAKLDDLKIMENNATTEEEKKTMVLWKELAEMFNEFTKEDAEICDALKINIFGEDAKKEINNFKKGMDPGQKMLIDKHNLNKFEEAIGNYFGTQAKKEDFTPDNHRIDMVYSESIGLLKGKSTSEMYEFYKKIGRKNNDCNKAQLKEKANAIEELFDEIMSWDMNEFNFKNDDELAENIGEKMLKAHLGMEMQTAVNNYKRMMVRKDVEGLKY
ncbi:MAG: hypothetical protein IIZ61_05975, partial [Lachnospiraceae bacterium]|nr:hypothetical protein [Lachnospiraceae bacterium]